MKQLIKYSIALLVCLPAGVVAQQTPVLPLDTILQRIDRNNILLQSYNLKAESYKYSADASTAWMAPMVGIGTFMTPYPGQMIMDPRDKGNIMLQIEQDIPNRAKLNARKRYIESQGNLERATRDITLNDFKAQAKRLYFNWLIAMQRINVLQENEKIMITMKKIEDVRYPYNQSQLGSSFKAEARIEENRNMIRMQEGTIGKARAWLNSLMNIKGNELFEIDTAHSPVFARANNYDTASLSLIRKDVLKMNENIGVMQLNIESMKMQKKPEFRIRFDQMFPLGSSMPNAYSIMGMISIPIVPWSSKMYKSEIRAMQFSIQGMEKEKSAMLQETQGMLYGMEYEIRTMQKRIQSMEEKIVPALQKALDANFISYQENKMQLTQVIDAWEALTMMQMNVLDEKLKLYEMIVDYEKQLYR
ncbi:MAG TPA: TolC family protein [Chitinophagaceae bacterium]|nr:TolC family protein [Chitinophagaceae bacterium]